MQSSVLTESGGAAVLVQRSSDRQGEKRQALGRAVKATEGDARAATPAAKAYGQTRTTQNMSILVNKNV